MMSRETKYPRGLYRARDGMIFGVCKGIARYLDVSLFWVRLVAVCMLFFTFFWVILAYIVAALLMKPEPILPLENEEEAEFYNSFASSRQMALHRLKRTYDNLERRIRRIENVVTAKDYQLDRRLNE